VRINGTWPLPPPCAEGLSVLWLTPAMDRPFLEGAGGGGVSSDTGWCWALAPPMRPRRALRSGDAGAQQAAREERPDPDWLTALEARMAEHGAAIVSAAARRG
jgi:DNA replication and repair protein RecF